MSYLDAPMGPGLLHQASIWRAWGDNGQLQTMLLEEMTPAHRQRALARLRELAGTLLDAERQQITRRHRQRTITDEQFARSIAALDAATPAMWIEEQALVRRFVQLGARPATLRRRGLLRRLIRR